MVREGGPKCQWQSDTTDVSVIGLKYMWPPLLRLSLSESVSIGSGESCDSWNDIMQQ